MNFDLTGCWQNSVVGTNEGGIQIVILALVCFASSACADIADRECLNALEHPPTSLDWSDGRYQLCSPLFDADAKRLAEDLQMTCTVYVDGVAVGSTRLRPGRVMRGSHGKTGTGIATGVCEVGGVQSRPAPPLEVKLS